MSVGDRIANKREELGYSQTELANKAGLKPPTISQYESGSRNPSYEALVKLSNALGVTTDFLIKGDQQRNYSVTGAVGKVLIKIIQGCTDETREKLLEHAELLTGKTRLITMPVFERPIDYAHYVLTKYCDCQLPIDVFRLAEQLGIYVFEQKLTNEEGLLVNGSRRIIILNSEIKHKPRKRFTLATLIGHAIFPWHIKERYARFRGKPTLHTEDVEEMEAHEFAVALIMPKFHLEKDLLQQASIEGLKTLATDKYDVSLFTLVNRLVEFDKDKYAVVQSDNYEIVQTFPGKRPLVQIVNPESFAGSFFKNPSTKEEFRKGEVPAKFWLEDAQPGEMVLEESVQNPDQGGKVLTLLTIKRRRR